MALTRNDCLSLLKEKGTPDNIIAHSVQVNRIAVFLAKKLLLQGVRLDYQLIDMASLLHDLDKWYSLKNGAHGRHSVKWLRELGYPDIANIVGKHVLESILSKKSCPTTWEEKLVYYADKRVTNDSIVSLNERFTYLKKQYGSRSAGALLLIQKSEPLVKKLENEIFTAAHMQPNTLIANLNKELMLGNKYTKAKAIIFDIWGTLAVNIHPTHHYTLLPQLLDIEKDPKKFRLIEEGLMQQDFPSKKSAMIHLTEYIKKKKGVYTGKSPKDLEHFWNIMEKESVLFPEVTSVLVRLKKRFKIGLVSNTQVFGLSCISPLRSLVDATALSYEEKLLKPDKKIFLSLTRKLNVKPSETVMVGDNYHDDVQAATHAGLMAMQIKRDNVHISHKSQRFYNMTIISLHDIERIMTPYKM